MSEESKIKNEKRTYKRRAVIVGVSHQLNKLNHTVTQIELRLDAAQPPKDK